MTNTTEIILQGLGIVAMAMLFVAFPIYAAVIAFRKGRKGWGIAALVSIVFLAGWLVGMIALFRKPDSLSFKSHETFQKSQMIALGAFFLVPILLIILSLSLRTKLNPPVALENTPATFIEPVKTLTPNQPQPTCDPDILTRPVTVESIADITSDCRCYKDAELTVTGRLCIPSQVSSEDAAYYFDLKPADAACKDGSAGTGVSIWVGDAKNNVREVKGAFISMILETNSGKEMSIGEEGAILTLRIPLNYITKSGKCLLDRPSFIDLPD